MSNPTDGTQSGESAKEVPLKALEEENTSVAVPQISTRLTAVEIAHNVVSSAESELGRPALSLFMSSLASGLAIGFSFLLGGFLMGLVPEPYKIPAASVAYPVGFILVIVARSELFTENTLTPVLAVLKHKSFATALATLRVWGLLLVGNLLGTIAFSAVVAHTPLVRAELQPDLLRLAEHAVGTDFWVVFYHAIFAGWLIALLTWMLASTTATGAQIVLIWLSTWAISALGFTHSIVGSVEAFYLGLRGVMPWADIWGGFLVPAILGNAVGGVTLVALLNYGQVAPEVVEQKRMQRQKQEEERLQRRRASAVRRWRQGL